MNQNQDFKTFFIPKSNIVKTTETSHLIKLPESEQVVWVSKKFVRETDKCAVVSLIDSFKYKTKSSNDKAVEAEEKTGAELFALVPEKSKAKDNTNSAN